MSAPPRTGRRAAAQAPTDEQPSSSSSSAPRAILSNTGCNQSSRDGHSSHHSSSSRHESTPPQTAAGSSPADRGNSMRSQRYGKWPPAGTSPANEGGSGSRQMNRQGSRTFTWPAYMDRSQLQQALKRGHVFRAKFRINAANRTEAFCTLEGLPSDMTVRGDVNHNRAVEGDEVAVLPFKLPDWFTVYKENSRLLELGLLPEGEDDPITLAEQLSQLAITANDADGVAAAQSPWNTAGSPAAALKGLEDILRARPDMRVTGKVVSILEPSPRREAIVGVLLTPAAAMAATAAPAGTSLSPVAAAAAAAAASGAYEGCLMLVPLDPRLPKGLVPTGSVAALPEALRVEAAAQNLTTRTFVAARITDWPAASPFPLVEVRQSLGPTGDIEAGTAALLAGEGLKDEDFGLEVYACLPKVPWSISPSDAAARADFTAWRIFSIDPITARDLDDALSIQPLGGGRWRMGVHIADVASFVKPGSALDEEAQVRGTSVYLVQRVIPMLPRLLCEQLCSLQPGDPRLAFSIVWEMDEQGHITKEWAGRSIINSCAKLAYPMVQQMIDGCFDPNRWQIQLYQGVTWQQIMFDCLALHGIASHLRAARFASGALRLTNTRLCFALDTGGNPVSASPYVTSEANWLVEEFMLLANMRVAGIIARAFPQHALLRRHPPPSERKMSEFKAAAALLGVTVDISSAGALQASLAALREACTDEAAREVIMLLATKPMQLAQYFCTGEAEDPHAWRHYALAVDLYTHFTSPIRRYPDVIVHRLLQAAIELRQQQQQPDQADLLAAPVVSDAQLPSVIPAIGAPASTSQASTCTRTPVVAAAAAAGDEDEEEDQETRGAAEDEGTEAEKAAAAAALLAQHQLPDAATMAKIAKHSNETKYSARMASDGSLRLYLCIMLKQAPVVTWAVVTTVGGDKFFNAYLPEFGCETRLYLNLMGFPLAGSWDDAAQTLTVSRDESPQQQQQQHQQDDEDAAAAPAGAGQGSQQQQQQEQRQELLLNSPKFDLRAWLEGLKEGVINTEHIAFAELPMQVRMFSRVPVVVGTYINRVTCHPEDLSAKLWLDCGAGGAVVTAAPHAAAPGEQVPSVMAYENLTED